MCVCARVCAPNQIQNYVLQNSDFSNTQELKTKASKMTKELEHGNENIEYIIANCTQLDA